MHIFLSGQVQIGKSTIINKTLELLGEGYKGFKTYGAEYKDDGSSVLYISPAENLSIKTRIATRDKAHIGKMEVDSSSFEVVGAKILDDSINSSCKLIIMDEIGFLESNYENFKSKVREALDSDKLVFGVLRNKNTAFLNELRERKDIDLIIVTEENRDSLPNLLYQKIKEAL